MSGFKTQVWVTSALTEKEVPRALTLCFSLKRALTTRKVVVITSPTLSTQLKDALHSGFDYLFYLEEDRNTARLKLEDFAKLSTLTLKPFEKCVFLSPNMMAMKNCDEIFDDYNVPQGFVRTRKGGSSIFMVKPSLEAFKSLMGVALSKTETALENCMEVWSSNNRKENVCFLDEKYNCLCSPQTGMLIGNENSISIVNLKEYPKLEVEIEGNGILAQVVLENWKNIYKWDVEPLLQWATRSANATASKKLNAPSPLTYETEPIAIIGMSCRFPASNNLEEFWELIINGRDGTGHPPGFRWTREHSHRSTAANRMTNAGFLKCPVDDFDAKFFNISPKEMVCMDPQHRLLHELTWEALEDAAVNPTSLEGTNGGVFIGSWTNDYKEIIAQSGNLEMYRIYMGNSIGASAARLSHLLGMTGPSVASESGCSSAMVAVHLACKSLQRRETNFALACGVSLLLHPFTQDELPMVVSSDGHCKTFDAKANGFARGEGCGVLVLKRLSDAVRDGDPVWALIRGSGMTQEGVSNSMGTPTVQCEAMAMSKALEDGNVLPEQVSYVETHGTGTIVGDPLEVEAIAKAYHSKERKEPLIIGSVKTNVGHTESTSGITGIIKVVLALHHEIIPQHINFETLNPEINLNAIPASIPLKPTEWKKVSNRPRLAGVSSFGITGTDAHVVLEEAPEIIPNSFRKGCAMERPLHIMKISAKNDEALELLVERYKDFMGNNQNEIEWSDVAYTANAGRADFSHRAVVIAGSSDKAFEILKQRGKLIMGEVNGEAQNGKICFLFTGQGSQYPGMAKELYETSPVFRIHFEYCEKILKDKYNIDITKVLWAKDKSEEVSRTIYSQTSIFCVEYALLKLWESWGVKADYALGHSLGEFAAAVCANLLTVEDALKLVAERSRLIDQLPRGKMLVIKAAKNTVDVRMTKFASGDKSKMLDYAAVNSDEQTVVAGDSDVVLQFFEFCKSSNLKCIVLEATHAFHSKHMDPILEKYRKVAKTVQKLEGNDCKYISGMKGSLIEAPEIDDEYWVQHTREKVSFLDASKQAVELGCKTFIEIGPQPVLSALTMMNNDVQLQCVPSMKKNEGEWETLLSTFAKLYVKGIQIDWKGMEQFYNRKKVKLPNYPFISKKFWPDLLSSTGLSIHPLVGSVIVNASPTKLFQCGLNLQAAEYVKDHAIGDHFIFPGSGYIEMCLAAGLATIENCTDFLSAPTRPMKLEDLYIEAPLALEESKTTQIQTVAELNTSNQEKSGDWNDISIKVYRRLEKEGSNWLSLSRATFCPIPASSETTNLPFDIEFFHQTKSSPPTIEEKALNEKYEKLLNVGLKFGPNFRSVEKAWRNEERETLLAKIKQPAEGNQQYLVHPVVLDAMIQVVAMLREKTAHLKKRLYVPFRIGKFVWLSSSDDNELYIHAFKDDTEAAETNGSCLLVDSAGKILAMMSNVELLDTTAKVIDSLLDHQTISMPDMWEENWKKTMSPLQSRSDLKVISDVKIFNEEFGIEVEEKFNKTPDHIKQVFDGLEKLTYLNMLAALYECGWKPQLNQSFEEEELFLELEITNDYRKYFGYMLEVMEAEGILKGTRMIDGQKWKVISKPMPLEEVKQLRSSVRYTHELTDRFRSTLLLIKVGECLSSILKGKTNALSILFPEETTKDSLNVADFYTEYGSFFRVTELIAYIGSKKNKEIRDVSGKSVTTTRILEVGAGTGSYTNGLFQMLENFEMDFEYHYTDISAAFFPFAEKRFEKHLKSIKFMKLNIEEDPIEQGFTPEYYDMVCASDVIHATKDIKQSLANLRMLMKPYAKFDLQEMTRVHRFVTYCFGLLEGFWRFEDLDLRRRHCTLTKQEWAGVFNQLGFKIDGMFSVLDDYHSCICVERNEVALTDLEISLPPLNLPKVWLLFHSSKGDPVSTYLAEEIWKTTKRQVLIITEGENYTEREDGSFFTVRKDREEDFKEMFKSVVAKKVKIEGLLWNWALAQNQNENEYFDQEDILQPYFHMTKAYLSTHGVGNPRIVCVGKSLLPVENIECDSSLQQIVSSSLWGYTKSFKNENVHVYCKCIMLADSKLDGAQRLKEIYYEAFNNDKELQVAYHGNNRLIPKFVPHKAANTALKLPNGTDRYQLILPETNSISDLQFGPLDQFELEDNEVEIRIRASALNFRDVLSVLKPTDKFKDINAVGFDFAGVIKRVGQKVTKWKVGDEVYSCNNNNTALPSHVKLGEDEIMAVPENITYLEAATLPAVYITSYVCLIDVAKIKKGETVLIHTASGGVGLSAIELCKDVGCEIIATAGSPRKQNYLRSLGIKHIFNSRNTQFGDQILELTKGRGVDVVLNSLTSEGFKEATLKACGKRARFIEMSKLNIWSDEEVKKLRPDVEYTIVDVSDKKEEEWKRLLEKVKELQKMNVVKPIPYVRFDGQNIREALQYMQKAKHIGKIVCVLPEIRTDGGEMKVYTPMFNPSSTYLITGGLGGIGFVVCQWMVEKGAKHVILAGRSPPSPSTLMKIKEMKGKGANIIVVQLDVGDYEQCKELLENRLKEWKLPQLRGIMHAAGTLSDGIIINQEWPKLSSTFNTKINGTLNLHELTKHLYLEHFVLFSSVAAMFGPSGQCNHAAGNTFEDAFAHYRNGMGHHATTINWGPWGEVGVAVELEVPGVKALSNMQGMTGLEYAMKMHRVQTAVMTIHSFVLLSKVFPHLTAFFDERVWKTQGMGSAHLKIKSEEFFQQYDALSEEAEKITLLMGHIKNMLRSTLKMEDGEEIDDNKNLQELGVDSLMYVELKNSMQNLLGERIAISTSALKDKNTAFLLSQTLVKQIEGSNLEDVALKPEEVNVLMREDAVLPEHIRPTPEVLNTKKSERNIKTVLLTGCTGAFGPYLLRELSNHPQISRIICLIRPKVSSADERLQSTLEGRGLLSQVDMRKIRCVSGNVAEPFMGLEGHVYTQLVEEVDAVFHCAASVNHTEHYRKRERQDTRVVNIEGVKNVLEFASEKKLKYVYHASTLITVATADDDGRLSEDWQEIGDYDNVCNYAYPCSKFVGEILLKEGHARGIPVKIFRFPLITGEMESGRIEIEKSHAHLRFVFILKSGVMPSNPIASPMVPVDTCAEVSVKLFFDERAEPGVYNINHDKPDLDQEFVSVAKRFGYEVEYVDISEFVKRVKESKQTGMAIDLLKEIYDSVPQNEETNMMAKASSIPTIKNWIEGNEEFFVSKKMMKLMPDFYEKKCQLRTMDYIYNDLMYAKGLGWFEKFGL